jgi:hypothetical protein
MSTAMTTVSPRGQRRRRSQLTIDELYNERQILRKEWMKFLDSMDSSDETSYEGNSTLPGCNVSEEITTDTAASTTAASTAAASTTSTITTAMSNKEILQVQSHLDYDYDCDNNDNDNDNNDPAYRFIKEQVDQLDEISKEFSDLPNMNMNLNMNMNNNNTPSPTGTSNDAFEQEWKALDKLESDLYKELTECDINVAANNIKSYVTSKDDDDGSYFVEGNNNNNNNNNNNTESEMNDEYRGEQHHQQQQQQIQQQQQQQQQKTTTILNNDGDSTTVSIIMMEKENNDDSIRDDIVVCVNDCNGEQQQQQQLEYECVSNDLLLYATKIMTTTKNKTIEEKESESPDNIGISHSRSSSSSSSSSSSTTASNTATALNHNDLLLHAAKIMTTKKNKTIEELESESPDNSGSSHSRSSSSSLLSSSATSNTATALKHMRRRRRSRSRSSISNSNEQPVVVTVTTTNNNSGSTISTTELLFTTKEKARNHNTSNDDGEGEGTIVLVEDNYSCIVNTNNDDDIDNGENTIIRHDDPGSSEEDSSEEEEEEEEEEKQQQQQIEQVEKKNITTTTPSDHDGDDSIQKFQCGKLSCFQNSNENPVPRTSVLAINVDEDDNDEKQHLKVINLIEYRIDINDSDIIGTGMMDANIDQQQQQQLCCAEMCSSAADSDVLDYVFENVESYTCGAADASVPRLGVVSPTGNKQLLLPDNTNNMLALNRDSSLVEGGPNGQPVQLLTTTREGDLLDYCFEHVESYICTSTSFDEDVYRNRYSKSVLPSPKKSSKPSAALQSKSLQQLQKEWYISLSSNNSMYKQDLSTISEISSRKEQPSPYNKIAGADVEAIESWRNSSSKKEEDGCAVHKNPPLPLPLPSSNTNASTGTTTSTITQAEDCQEEEEEEEEEEEGYELKVDGIKSSDYNNEPSLSPSVEKVDEEIVVEAVYDNVITAHDEEKDDDVNDLLNNIATNTSSDEEVEDLHQQPQQHQQQVQIQIQIQIQNEHQPISPLLCERIVPPVLADIAHQESSSIHCRSNSNNSNNSTNNNQCSNITPAPAPATSPDKSTTTNNSNAQKSHTIRVTPFSSFNKPSPSETKLNELNNEQQFLDDRNDFSTVVVTKISSITVEEEDNGMIVSSPGFGRDGCDIDAAALLNQILLEVDKDIEVIELPHKKMSVTDGTVYKWQDQNNDNGDYAVSSNNSFTTIPTVAIEEEEKQSINELPPPSAAAVPSFLSPNLTFELDAASNESSDLMWSKWSVNEYPSDEPPQKQESMEHDGVASCLELEVMNTTVCGTASDGEVSPLTTPIHHVEEQQEQEQEANTAPTPTSYTFFSNIPAVKKSIEGDDEDDEDGQEQNDDNIDVVPIHDDDHDDNEYCDTTNNNNNNIIIHTNKSNESQDSSSSISQVLGRVYARIIKGNNNKNSSGSSIIKSIINNKGNDTNNDNSIVNEQQQRQGDDNSTIVENIPTQEVVATTTTNDNGRFTSDNDNDANGIEVIYDEKEDDSSNGTVGVDCNDGSNDGDASTTKTTATTRSLSPASVAEIMELRSDDDEISSLVRHSNQKVLDSIVNQDYDTYSKITSDDITGIDCYDIHNSNDNSIAPTTATATATTSIMASTMIVEGRSACWNKMIASINNKHNRPTTIKFITTTRPTVRKISSDVIVLVYSRYDHHNFDNENSEKQQHQQQGISSKNSATTSTSTSSNSFITTSNETRIWKKIMIKQNEEEKWVNCHFHRSLAS